VDAKNRPVFLDLTKMRFPPMAIISIMHRISGVFLFLLLPFVLYLLHGSLASAAEFDAMKQWLSSPIPAFVMWVFVCSAAFHLFAGIRHMVMDLGFGEHLCTAKWSAYFLLLLEIIVMIFVGVWLW